jgi:leader peptidase (prepilin peptidase)/N-methyltransferase
LENLNFQLGEVLLIAWFFILGSVFGSFLNVVVYRLPRGMSLIEPSSHCPVCNRHIRWFDNIPIISWFVLRGRCRDCGAAISVRYPLVEALTAGMFAIVAAEELYGMMFYQLSGIFEVCDFGPISARELYGTMLYHLLLLCTLLSAGLMEIDGHRPPWRLFAPALLVGVFAPLAWPYLRPVHAWPSLTDFAGRAADCLAGLAAGGLFGYLAWRVQKTASPGGLCWGLLCAGVFLGWQAVCVLTAVMVLIVLIVFIFRRHKNRFTPWPFSIWLYTVTLVWILLWPPIVKIVK